MLSGESPQKPVTGPEIPSSLAGSLLLAVPKLQDPNFQRMAVLMISHDEEGAFGLVLGPASTATVQELCATLDTTWERGDDVPVRYGGPCEPSRIWIIHGGEEALPGAATVAPGVHMGSSIELLRQLSAQPQRKVVILSGYAGWGPGQLEHEMLRESWLPGEVTAELVFGAAPDEVWEAALRDMDLTPGMIISGQGASA